MAPPKPVQLERLNPGFIAPPGDFVYFRAMISPARVICLSLIFWLLISAGGCAPKPETEADEQKERNYLTGRRRLAALDYPGAVEAFEQALVVNPRSASAHFELGVLYEQKLSDYAAAIYHYERALRFRPDLPQAANIRPRIKACKVELADREALVPVNAAVQKDLDRLTAENLRLRQQAGQWLAQLAQLSNSLALSSAAVQRANNSWTNPLPPGRSGPMASSNSFGPPADGSPGSGASRAPMRPPGRSV